MSVAPATQRPAPPPAWRRLVELVERRFVSIVAYAALVSYLFVYQSNCFTDPPIRADGAGYYAYLPSLLIHGDPSGQALARTTYGGEIPEWTGLNHNPETGRYADKYNMGVALLMSPFFLAAHAVTWIVRPPPGGFDWWQLNYASDGYSLFYQHAAGLAGMCYFLAGLALMRRLLRTHFGPGIVVATMTLMLVGTNLYHYGTAETVFATPYSFLLFTAFLLATRWWYERPGDLRRSLLIGALAGLIALVRINNLLFALVFALYGITRLRDLPDRIRLLLRAAGPLAAAAALTALIFLPQLFWWRYTTGHWLSYSYREEGFHWLHPHLFDVLYSVEHGLFFYSPVLLMALPGLWALRRFAPRYFAGAIVYLPLQWYVISSWWQWPLGGSLSHRAFVEAYSLVALAIASFLASLRTRRERALTVVFSAAACAIFLFFAKLYYTREMSELGLTRSALYDVLYTRRNMIHAWFK